MWIGVDEFDDASDSAEAAAARAISAMAFEASGRFLAIASSNVIRVVDVTDGTTVEEYRFDDLTVHEEARNRRVESVQFSDDARHRLAITVEKRDRCGCLSQLWVFETGRSQPVVRRSIYPYMEPRRQVGLAAAAFLADGHSVAVLDAPTGSVVLLHASSGDSLGSRVDLGTIGRQNGSVPEGLFVAPDNRTLVVAAGRDLNVYDIVLGRSLGRVRGSPGADWCILDMSADGSKLLAAESAMRASAVIVDISNGKATAVRRPIGLAGRFHGVYGSLARERVLWRPGPLMGVAWFDMLLPDLLKQDLSRGVCRPVLQSRAVAERVTALHSLSVVSRDGNRLARAGDSGVLITRLRRVPDRPAAENCLKDLDLPPLAAGGRLFRHRFHLSGDGGGKIITDSFPIVRVDGREVTLLRSSKRAATQQVRVPRAPLERGQEVWWPYGPLLTRDPNGTRWWKRASLRAP